MRDNEGFNKIISKVQYYTIALSNKDSLKKLGCRLSSKSTSMPYDTPSWGDLPSC